MNVYISSKISNEKQYLQSIYPISWSPFISGAMKFPTVEEARETMNSIYKNLFYYPDFSIESFYSIKFVCIERNELGVTTSEKPYVSKEV